MVVVKELAMTRVLLLCFCIVEEVSSLYKSLSPLIDALSRNVTNDYRQLSKVAH